MMSLSWKDEGLSFEGTSDTSKIGRRKFDVALQEDLEYLYHCMWHPNIVFKNLIEVETFDIIGKTGKVRFNIQY